MEHILLINKYFCRENVLFFIFQIKHKLFESPKENVKPSSVYD